MREPAIQNRVAAVRKSWSYGERLQRALAAQQRCQRLFSQLGLAGFGGEMMLARQTVPHTGGRR